MLTVMTQARIPRACVVFQAREAAGSLRSRCKTNGRQPAKQAQDKWPTACEAGARQMAGSLRSRRKHKAWGVSPRFQ